MFLNLTVYHRNVSHCSVMLLAGCPLVKKREQSEFVTLDNKHFGAKDNTFIHKGRPVVNPQQSKAGQA